MVSVDQKICERLIALINATPHPDVRLVQKTVPNWATEKSQLRTTKVVDSDEEAISQWATSCQNILRNSFSVDSDHYANFKEYSKSFPREKSLNQAKGVLKAALEDYANGYVFDLRGAIAGELFQDFVALAKRSLSEGNKDVAAVLACVALEDALKRYAERNGITVDGGGMSEVIAALKAKGLVGGAQKSLLDTMPKIRNAAMHADWAKIQEPDVGSVIGFVEQFLTTHF